MSIKVTLDQSKEWDLQVSELTQLADDAPTPDDFGDVQIQMICQRAAEWGYAQATQPAQVPPLHDSDCSQHNEPAYPSEPCDCSIAPVQVCVERGRVWIKRGVQSFMLAYDEEDPAARDWYANQLRKALSIITPDVKSAAAPSTKEQSNG